MGARRKSREYALQALYLTDITRLGPEKALTCVTYGEKVEARIRGFAKDLAEGAQAHLKDIDALIKKYAENWEIDRMAALDRNILRLGAYELIYQSDTPVSVVIDEAVEIAKTFSTPDSGKFVNGILDKIKTERGAVGHGQVEPKES